MTTRFKVAVVVLYLLIPLILLSFVISVIAGQQDHPALASAPRQDRDYYRGQDVQDAIQDQRILAVEAWQVRNAVVLDDLRARSNLILGVGTGFGALLTGLHFLQMQLLRHKGPAQED